MTENGDSGGTAIDELRHTCVPATAERLPALRHALSSWAFRAGVAWEQVEELALATYEAMANVVEHAYPSEPGTFDLLATHLPEQECVEVTVVDRGRWKSPATEPGPLHGRGIPLMRDLAQHVTLWPSPTGTTAVLRWRL